jgi:hypothetical protein
MPEESTTPQQPEKPKRKHRKKELRLFNGTDAAFIQSHNVLRKHFLNYLPAFITFDSSFGNPFAADWLLLIEECEGLPVDETHLGEQEGISDIVKDAVLRLIAKVAELEFFVHKAFPGDDDLHYEFQFNKVSRLDQYDVNFIVNCLVIRLLVINFYETDLLAVGMPPTFLAEYEALCEQTASTEMLHKLSLRIRIHRARVRVKTLNRLYKTGELVKKAAKVIFKTKPDVAGLFG